MITLLSLVLVAALAAEHLFSRRTRFLSVLPRSGWLSAAGGAFVLGAGLYAAVLLVAF